MINHFSELNVWKKSRLLSLQIFKLTKQENFARDFKLRDQINGASGSTMDNIAEGFGRKSKFEFINFLSIAAGSNAEVQSQLRRACDREYVTEEKLNELLNEAIEIDKMISKFISYLNKSQEKGLKFKDREK